MKKITVLGIIACMSLVLTMGCGNETSVISESFSESVSVAGEVEKSDEDTNSEAYLDFINGNTKTKVNNSYIEWLENGSEYTYEELNQAFISYMNVYSSNIKLSLADYAFIDCGADGVPELALNQIYSIESDEANVISVFKIIDDKMYLVSSVYGYYRSYVDINKFGYISYGGSDGAASSYTDYRFVNKDGEEVFLYSESIEICEYNGEYINSMKYNFSRYSYDSETGDEEYKKNDFFTFTDMNNQFVEPNEELIGMYLGDEATWYDSQETERLIREYEESLGVTDRIRAGEDFEWITFFSE